MKNPLSQPTLSLSSCTTPDRIRRQCISIFSGGAAPPPEAPTNQEIRSYERRNQATLRTCQPSVHRPSGPPPAAHANQNFKSCERRNYATIYTSEPRFRAANQGSTCDGRLNDGPLAVFLAELRGYERRNQAILRTFTPTTIRT